MQANPLVNNLSRLLQMWSDIRIGARLTIGVSIILLLTLIVGLVGWFTLESQSRSQILANQAIDLVSALRAARQDEKNYMLGGKSKHVKETLEAIETIRQNAEILQASLPYEGRKIVAKLLLERDSYQREFEGFVEFNNKKEMSLKEMVAQGRELENTAVILRDDQKKELQRLEALTIEASQQRQEKSEKADSANRIIKLMGEARQQEKNFLLRKEQSYAEVTKSLVSQTIKEAEDLRKRFKDRQNQALVTEVIQAAQQYIVEFNKIVVITDANTAAQDTMASLGRRVEDRSSQLRGDQKQELQRLEKLSTQSSKQRLDKRIKADAANRIIKLMGEARQQEKNFLLRKEQAYVDITRSLVNQAQRQAELLRERFLDQQNRELAQKIITAATTYLSEFEDVVVVEDEQQKQKARMVNAARNIETLASKIRNQTQQQADATKETAVFVILFTLSLALILGVAAAIILTNSIANPIQQLVIVINKLANEDENVVVPLVQNQDEIGQIARAIANFKEVILQRKEKTEAQLIQAEKMAALGDLVAGVAHEINTPIGIAVTGSSHLQDQITLLEKTFSAGALRKSEFKAFIDNAMPTATTIQSNLERASALIKSFKQVAVDQSSQVMREFALVGYIDEVLISLHPKLKQTSHKVSVKGDKKLVVRTVPGALSQIITNLVINSLTHAFAENSTQGNMLITIENTSTSVILTYSDDGSGMDAEIMNRIYEPFFTTRRGSGGSGLGLSIIFNLVSQTLGGTIHCQSELGKGSHFTMTFPITSAEKIPEKQVSEHE